MRKLIVWLSYGVKYNQESYIIQRGLKPTFFIGLFFAISGFFVSIIKNSEYAMLFSIFTCVILAWKLRKSKINFFRKVNENEFDFIKEISESKRELYQKLAFVLGMLLCVVYLFVGVIIFGFALIITDTHLTFFQK